MTDIDFSRPLASSADLNFGAAETPAVYLDISISANLLSSPLIGAISVDTDNAVARGPGIRTQIESAAARKLPASFSCPHQQTSVAGAEVKVGAVGAQAVNVEQHSVWSAMTRRVESSASAWRDGTISRQSMVGSWVNLSPRLRPALQNVFKAARSAGSSAGDAWINLRRDRRPAVDCAAQAAVPISASRINNYSAGRPAVLRWSAAWRTCSQPAPGITLRPVDPQPPEIVKYNPSTALRFRGRLSSSSGLNFVDQTGANPVATVVVPIRTQYMTINTQSIVLAATGEAIEASDIQLSIDRDSWTWRWSAEVPAAYEPALTAPPGELIPLIITINGFSVNVVATVPQRDRSFGKSSLSINGRGTASWLAEPFADSISRRNSELMTAQQIMAAALSINGVSIGWDIDWQITDWSVPAGAWEHKGTAIEACESIAAAAGAYIQAHPTAQVLRVLPIYPALPWHWDEITPDFDIPEDVCVVETLETTDKPMFNSVVTHGQVGGVRVHVTRSGSDGGRPAPMIINSLITDLAAGRQSAAAVLSDVGRQKMISITMPVLEETGVILPGKFIRYRENGKINIGLSRAVSISGAFPKTRQTIRVETHVL